MKTFNDYLREGKLYKPSDVRNPYFRVGWLMLIMAANIYGVVIQIRDNIVQEWLLVFVVFLVPLLMYLITKQFVTCIHVILTDDVVIGFNDFKKVMAEIYFRDIKFIYKKKWNPAHDVVIEDAHGNKLIINAVIEPMDEFFNTIIEKAMNCEKIDLRSLEKVDRYPRLMLYKKNVD